MTETKKKLLYFIYIIVVTIFCLYFLFPSEAAKKYIIYNIKKASPQLNLSIGSISPIFPPGLRLEKVALYNFGDLLFGSDHIKVRPGIISLFSPITSFYFNGKGYKGSFSGKVDIIGKMPDVQFNVDYFINNVQLNDVPAVRNLSDYKVSGILNGKTKYYSAKGPTGTLEAKLHVSSCKIELMTSVYNIESFTFKDIDAEIDVEMPKIKIKKSDLKGDQVDGSLIGDAIIMSPIGRSVLNFSGMVNPHPLFLKDLGKVFPVDIFLSKKAGKNGFSFRIDGSLDKPGFSLK